MSCGVASGAELLVLPSLVENKKMTRWMKKSCNLNHLKHCKADNTTQFAPSCLTPASSLSADNPVCLSAKELDALRGLRCVAELL